MFLDNASIDLLQELLNIGMGRAAAVLSDMIDAHIKLQVPEIRVINNEELLSDKRFNSNTDYSQISMRFEGGFSGNSMLAFPKQSAAYLVKLLTDEDYAPEEIDSLKAGTLSEVGNILLNSILGSISNISETEFAFSLPRYAENNFNSIFHDVFASVDNAVLLCRAHFEVKDLAIDGDVFIFLNAQDFENLKKILDTANK